MFKDVLLIWKSKKKIRIAVMVMAEIILIVSVAFATADLLGYSGDADVSDRQAVDEARHLMPPVLNGLTVGQMLDSISWNTYWWTNTQTKKRFFLPDEKAIWVHFHGETYLGYMRASISIDRSNGLVNYNLFIGGRPVQIDHLYEMFFGAGHKNSEETLYIVS